jgi:hypothetical protein
LHELWLTEYGWSSIEVFTPIYDIISAMMALHGFVFAKTNTEWRMVLCEGDSAEPEIRSALAKWLEREN